MSGQGEMAEINGYSHHMPRVIMSAGTSTEHLHPLTLVPASNSISLSVFIFSLWVRIFFQRVSIKLGCPLS